MDSIDAIHQRELDDELGRLLRAAKAAGLACIEMRDGLHRTAVFAYADAEDAAQDLEQAIRLTGPAVGRQFLGHFGRVKPDQTLADYIARKAAADADSEGGEA